MVALQIRDVPDEIRDRLAAKAASRGQSLQAYLLRLVTADAEQLSNVEIVERLRASGGGAHLKAGEAAEFVRAARREAGRE